MGRFRDNQGRPMRRSRYGGARRYGVATPVAARDRVDGLPGRAAVARAVRLSGVPGDGVGWPLSGRPSTASSPSERGQGGRPSTWSNTRRDHRGLPGPRLAEPRGTERSGRRRALPTLSPPPGSAGYVSSEPQTPAGDPDDHVPRRRSRRDCGDAGRLLGGLAVDAAVAHGGTGSAPC